MVKKVIKKDGKKQGFDSKKIKKCLTKACKGRKISKTQLKKLENKILKEVTELSYDGEITTAQIRDIVLKNLNRLHPALVKAWIAYEILKLQQVG